MKRHNSKIRTKLLQAINARRKFIKYLLEVEELAGIEGVVDDQNWTFEMNATDGYSDSLTELSNRLFRFIDIKEKK